MRNSAVDPVAAGLPTSASGGPGYLLLEDGRRFDGVLFGAAPSGVSGGDADPGLGEVVFQTGMTGYQEVITDPSYRGQIVTFTAVHLGNVGMNRHDAEAPRPALAGVVCRALTDQPSNWRSEEALDAWLTRHGVPGLREVDTRALTRHLRTHGAQRGMLVQASVDAETALRRVKAFPGLGGRDLVREVMPATSMETWEGSPFLEVGGVSRGEGSGSAPADPEHEAARHAWSLAEEFPALRGAGDAGALEGRRITLVHCGLKEGIDVALRRRGALVRVVRPDVGLEGLLYGDPDGLVLSNGPGDPEAIGYLVDAVRGALGRVPMLGICLGHQMLARALGGKTYKLRHGHHGINHPVRDERTGRVLVTSQNHEFAVDIDSVAAAAGGDVRRAAEITHISLNDGTLEGFAVPELRIQAVQFHPEACGGPHDAASLFEMSHP